MGDFYIHTKGVGSWKESLADPDRQWKPTYSAYELAHCWEKAENLPTCVEKVFKESTFSIFQNVKILYGFPEYRVTLPGHSTKSQTDLYLLTISEGELLPIMVEGKASETFGEKVTTWFGENPSVGKRIRLDYLLKLLNLREQDVLNKRYQLLHRTASVIIEAQKLNAKNALVLVHSFNEMGKWFDDYACFVELFGLSHQKDAVVGPVVVNGVNLYFGWVTRRMESNL